MLTFDWKRRDFIKTLLVSVGAGSLDWDLLPCAEAAPSNADSFDTVIIGSGLGGLSCAAAFARQGFRPLVLDQHDKPGGYATAFSRPGGFQFDVSLHSTGAGQRDGLHNLIPGFPEIKSVEFVPHPTLYRAIFPHHDFRVPNRNLPAYLGMLKKDFPGESGGIDALFDEMKGVTEEIGRLSAGGGKVSSSNFPSEFPHIVRFAASTWAQIIDAHLKDPRLKGIVSAQWAYYGLPPSKLASIYYGMPYYSYLTGGGFYPKGRSQTISNALTRFIEERGGRVQLNTHVAKILVKDEKAYGVKTADGQEFLGRVVVSNANAYDTFHTLLEKDDHLNDYLSRLDTFSVSLSCFQIFLGLKTDLVHQLGITDSEIFYNSSYDPETTYEHQRAADFSIPGFCLTLYDNLFPDYSPKGKNTINLLVLQGYDHWKSYEPDYWKGNKAAYHAEKSRLAAILIQQAEKTLLPGLSKAIEVQEIGTPLTNVRYTGNYRGAIYGWDQTLDNSNPRRLPHTTPIQNLYLAGAWTSPGHGYGGVIASGLECFGEIMKTWG
jgi:phytoene dehydrogenase-like protein